MRQARAHHVWGALLCVLAATGCGSEQARSGIPEPPQTIESGWRLVSLERPSLETTPEALRSYRPRERQRNIYRSYSSMVLVEVYRMPTQATAFEAMQKWRNEPGTVVFQYRHFFVICSSAVEPTQGLIDFSAKLEKEWLATVR